MPRVPARWIRGPADNTAVEQGCVFDEAAGDRPCLFIERFCRQSKGRWAGEPLRLLPWQRDFLMRLFGWKRPDGSRRYRRAYLEIAKKNGKSTLLSALVIYLLLADGEGAPEIYLNACDREQAAIIFDESARMVRSSPDLDARLRVYGAQTRKFIRDPAGDGKIVANSADVPSKDGVNSSAVVFDELHRQKTRALWEIFEYAGTSRRQPLTVSITTAGEDAEGVWHEQRHYSDQVNEGLIPDVTHLGVVYRALDADDLDDPETWRKANPSLGVTIDEADFAREWAEAKAVPTKLANFKRLRLNIIARGEAQFLAPGAWEACRAESESESLDGKPCRMGLDLSSTTDLSALAVLYGDDEHGYDVRMRFWLPEDDIVALEQEHGVPYRTWADKGFITLTPGNVIDYDFIRQAVIDESALRPPTRILIDPYNANQLAIKLRQDDGLPVEFLRQGFISLSGPTKELERLVLSGKLRHDGDPILAWNASNAVAVRDEAGNVKLSKRKSRKKIDGMAALVNAVAAAMADSGEGESVYETRGVEVL